jgi:hypothetical protein
MLVTGSTATDGLSGRVSDMVRRRANPGDVESLLLDTAEPWYRRLMTERRRRHTS